MVVADLIVSNASKDGGFQLKKSIEEISLYDVYKAIETTEITDFKSEIARKLFKDEEHIKNSEDRIIDTINKAEDTLKKLKLSALLDSKSIKIVILIGIKLMKKYNKNNRLDKISNRFFLFNYHYL